MYERALAELAAGAKRGHWIWFVLPQLVGLGSSPTAARYGITGAPEAAAYLAHPVLGARLRETVETLVHGAPDADAERVLGPIDTLKLRSSLTLFARVARDGGGDGAPFTEALRRFFGGAEDPITVRRLTVAEPGRG